MSGSDLRLRASTANEPDVFESVARRSTTDSVVDQIEALIVEHKLQIGDMLPPERELSGLLGVSRNVLREALGVLGQKGLVKVTSGRGTRVAQPSADTVEDALSLMIQLGRIDLVELCDVRLLIEPEMASLAAERITPEGVRTLEELMRTLQATHYDSHAHVEADLDFHAEIASAARHTTFQAIVNAVKGLVIRSMMFGTSVPRAVAESDEHHREVIEAIRERDSEGARSAMIRHLKYVRSYVIDPEHTERTLLSGSETSSDECAR